MRARVAILGCAVMVGAGCDLVLGLDNPTPGTGGSGATGGGGTGATAGSAGSSGSTGTTGGGGATGGGGSGTGGSACTAGTKVACYSGAAGTMGVGQCKGGEKTCKEDGSGFGPCEGEVVPGEEVCFDDVDEDCDGAACAKPLWSQLWGDVGDQEVLFASTDGAGRLFLAGRYSGSLNIASPALTSGSPAGYLARVSESGQGTWSKTTTVPDALACNPAGKCVTAKNGVSMTFTSTNLDGSDGWVRVYGSAMAAATRGMSATASDFLATGGFTSTLSVGSDSATSAGGNDIFLVRLGESDGIATGVDGFGTTNPQFGLTVSPGAVNETIVSGTYSGTLLDAAEPTVGESLFALGVGTNGATTWKLTAAGQWARFDMAVNAAGDAVIAGRFSGSAQLGNETITASGVADPFIAKISSGGVVAWAKSFPGSTLAPVPAAVQAGASVAVDSQGNVLLSFRGEGFIDLGGGAVGKPDEKSEFLAKFGPNGDHLWSRAFGPVGANGGCVVRVSTQDEPVLACSIEAASIDMGTGPLTGKGGLDVAVARFGP